MEKRIILLFILMITILPVSSGANTSILQDTSNYILNQQIFRLIREVDSISYVDSLKIVKLNQQLDQLKDSELKKRQLLEEQLLKLQLNDSLRKAEIYQEIADLKTHTIAYPIIPHKDTLFSIYTRIGSITASERARLINERLEILYHEFFLQSDSLHLISNSQNVDLYYKDRIILSVTESDAIWFERDQNEIAESYKSSILNDLSDYKKDRNLFSWMKEIGLTLLVIIIQIALIKLINFLFRGKINKYIWAKRGVWFNGIKIKNYEVLDKNRETSLILFILKVIRYGIILILLYLSIPILFSIFPPTRRLANLLFGYILTPVKKIALSVVEYIPELFTIVIIVIITRYILKFFKFLSKEIQAEKLKLPGFFPDWAGPTYNIVKVLILAFMFIVIFPYLPGSDSPVFKGVSVFLGIVFSLGSSSIIGNMVAGLVITYMRPFQIGDRIKIGDVLGDVIEKTPFVTRLRTPKKEFITLPNSNILASSVVNYSTSKKQDGIILHTTVTIGYDIPWRQVHQLLIDAALKTEHINKSTQPFVLQTSLDDFYVSYQLNAHTNEPSMQPAIYSELHQNIQDGFNEAGIEIMSPHYRAARDGNTVAIPFNYWPKDYKIPGFRMEKRG